MNKLTLINDLSVQKRYWSIKFLLIKKDEVRNFKTGGGKLQKLIMQDTEGTKINVIMFNETIDKFTNMLEIQKKYIISNGQVKEINKNFYHVHEKIEIILNNLTEIQEVNDDNDFISISKLSSIADIKENPNLPADIVLLVVNINKLGMVYRQRDKKQVFKRDLDVFDLKSQKYCLTLWESLATKDGEALEQVQDEHPVIFATSIVGRYFNGFTLSTTSATVIEINPDLPERKILRDWFFENQDSLKSSESNILITDLMQVITCELPTGKSKFYDIKVSIKGIREGNIWYDACDTCKTKVTIYDESVQCSKCNNQNVQHSLRYLIKLDVADLTADATLTLFDDEAEKFIGIPVTDLYKMKDSDIENYNIFLTSFVGCYQTFSIKAQDKIYGNRSLRTLTVQSFNKDLDETSPKASKKIKVEID